MSLPLEPPLKPQLALSRKELPEGEDYCYEVKLDGFRCIAFVDGGEVFLQSRNGKPLGRYFPELTFPAGRYVLDGEIVVRDSDGREDFDALGQRIHPAVSRIERLAGETPAVYVAFDLLAHEQDSLLELPFAERRAALEALLAGEAFARAPVELMQTVASAQEAEPWLAHAEGAIAKERSAPYRPGERKGMAKVKRVRTIDAVIVGWRPGKEPDTVGALILGLYDGRRAARRRALLRPQRRREEAARRLLRRVRVRRARLRRPQPLERRQGSRVGRAAPRAGRGDRFRPRLRRAHPPRRQAAPLAR